MKQVTLRINSNTRGDLCSEVEDFALLVDIFDWWEDKNISIPTLKILFLPSFLSYNLDYIILIIFSEY